MKGLIEEFEEKGRKGLKNSKGDIILPARYETLIYSSRTVAGDPVVAKKNGMFGILRLGSEEKWILEPEYEYIGLPEGYCSVRRNGYWGVFNIWKEFFVIPCICDQVEGLQGIVLINNIGVYSINGKYGILENNGEVTPPIFDDIDFDVESFVKAKIGANWGFITEDWKLTDDEDLAHFYNS